MEQPHEDKQQQQQQAETFSKEVEPLASSERTVATQAESSLGANSFTEKEEQLEEEKAEESRDELQDEDCSFGFYVNEEEETRQDPLQTPSVNEKQTQKTSQKRKTVHFDQVQVREYAITIGDSPYCSRGAPLSLDWDYTSLEAMDIDRFEFTQKRRNSRRRMMLDSHQRRSLLWASGHKMEDIDAAAKKNERDKFRQSVNLFFLPLHMVQELVTSQADKICGKQRSGRGESERMEAKVRQLHRHQLQQVQVEEGGLTPWQQEAQHCEFHRPLERRLSFRNRNNSQSSLTSGHSSTPPADEEDAASCTSTETPQVQYHIRTDPRQHDKATEIILCSIARPHMRAFHASWFGFFIGFVMWFAITPLLGEVKDTLDLTNAQIWTSSLAGTAVTVVARILMGPLCDVYGARHCMAAIVIVTAIPCGLTGLVNSAAGLSAVRALIGIGGSTFVPCQYWTSRMFAREVAGTANAMVAGWGNLGGGITQLMMGSALFPLFTLLFQEHDNANELAWRTVFVVPALIAFAAAYVYIFKCDDSPKGDFAELVRQQQIEMVSPFWSLGMAIQNRNVILLLVQYSCCFGVEITFTNATALYMREEFGLDTVSAAAVASIFGITNLFARGLGGYGSDFLNSRYGTKGRVVWQGVTLFLEGAGIIVFAYMETLAGAIFSLIFLSLWVQASEGATYGIVPYVNRRFTGAVVGWVGAGGAIGGVIFSIFFREFRYEKAFLLMGISACGSAFLSFFMNMKSLNAIYEEKMRAHHIKNNHNLVFHDDAPVVMTRRRT